MALLRDPDVLAPHLADPLDVRWSPRAFDDQHQLDRSQLHLLLEAARWAPSSGNSQPWSFIVGLRGDETFDGFYEHLSRGNKAWAHRASALLVAIRQTKTGPDHELPWAGYSQYDLGQAAAHLTIQAHALGLHVHQFAGFDAAAVQERFAVPGHWQVTTGIAVGVPTSADVLDERTREKELAPRTRRPLQEFVFTGTWGQTPIDLT